MKKEYDFSKARRGAVIPTNAKRRRNPPGIYRAVFADNLRAHLNLAYPTPPDTRIDRPALFFKDHPGLFSKSTITRWLNLQAAPTLDQIESVANALGTKPYALLIERQQTPKR